MDVYEPENQTIYSSGYSEPGCEQVYGYGYVMSSKNPIEPFQHCYSADYGSVKIADSNYPEQLAVLKKNSQPKKLYCLGNLSLFQERILMICGARNTSGKGLELAYKCGRLAADSGYIVASGYARGVDMAAHLGTLAAGGGTIAVLPYGLDKFRINKAITESFDPELFLAVSEYQSYMHFSVKNAFRRNKLLAALSQAVIVIEPGETGGTWNSAHYARKLDKPLFFLEGNHPELIPKLEAMGGRRLKVKRGVPDLKAVFEVVG